MQQKNTKSHAIVLSLFNATLKQNFSFTPNTMLYLKDDLGYAFNRTKSTTLNVILHDYTGNGQDYI